LLFLKFKKIDRKHQGVSQLDFKKHTQDFSPNSHEVFLKYFMKPWWFFKPWILDVTF